ncbi:MAG: glycosyltransferase family 1 protein [Acidobacteriota bacterium]
MLFSVDAHAIGCRLTGNEVYVRNLLWAFAAVDHSSEFIAYLAVDGAEEWVPRRFLRRRVARNPFLRLGGDLSRQLRRDRPDLIHVQYTAPLGCPVPVVVSVHDVSFLEHPQYFTPWRARQLRWTVRRTVEGAARVLTGSEFSARAIARAYGLNGDNVVVVPNAASGIFRPIARDSAAAAVRARFGLAEPFLLTVGDLQPRKNQVGLIDAFAALARAHPRLRHHLVLAGQETWHALRVRRAAERSGVGHRIHFTGFVTDDELLHLYNACELFVFPSFYEGFGLPLVEAMACGKAVACSNTSALPEVADAAAIFFDPHATDQMCRAMADLILDAELRSRMERLGLQRAAQFSWQKTAERTLEIYHAVAGHKAGRLAPAPRR